MENFSIFEFIKEKFIGKTFKHCIKREDIIQPYSVWIKKSGNVTDKQFEGGNPRFRRQITRHEKLGTNVVYGYSKVVSVHVSYSNGYEGYNGLRITLEDGGEFDLEVDTEIIQLDKDTYFYK